MFYGGNTGKPETVKKGDKASTLSPALLPESKPEVKQLYQKKDVSEDQQQYVRLASLISNNDLDFLLTLNAENGLFTPDRLHPKNKNGSRDYGFCGLNSTYHWKFINSPDFKDPEKQLRYCYEVFKARPTAFYGYKVRNKHKSKFQLITLNK